ncbi:cell volume regulation protein A [Amnibacterium kyonggiense]|uniref:Cell volume regulation protein A n=1 Tax=Amnibacterium kyonggiense TaxID=595671 RepID=A0A4R7FSB4_9MICO|nr:cell volume regulation protein A [Amnibacterium kyonggiense]
MFAVVVLLAALALVAAIAVNALGSRIRVPAPALFLVVAAVVSNVVPDLERISLVVDERIVTVCLILILFDGGMHIGWRRFRATAGPITFVGALGTALTAAAVALIAHLLLGLDWQAALLLGAALSPTDPAVVFAVLGRKEVEGRSGTLLEGESGFNDPVGIALLGVLLAAGTGVGAVVGGVGEFLLQMGVGIAVGAVGGLLLGWLQRRVRLPNEALYPLRTIAFAALIYGAATLLHGSGFLAVFLAGILVGDNRAPYEVEVRRFSSGLASLAEIIAFTVLGLSVSLDDVLRPDVLLPGLVLAALLIVVIRPLLVGPLLLPIRLARGERAFVLFAGLKGAVPILLGILIRDADVPGAERIAAIIFVVVIVSVVVQGGLVPWVAALSRVPMRDVEQQPYAAGLRFSEEPADLQRFVVRPGSAAEGATVADLSLGEHGWVSLIRRGGASVPLRGGTRLEAGDEVLAFAEPGLDVGDLFRAGA